MGVDQWREEDGWPPPDTRYETTTRTAAAVSTSQAGKA
jgi:hypothetical protein